MFYSFQIKVMRFLICQMYHTYMIHLLNDGVCVVSRKYMIDKYSLAANCSKNDARRKNTPLLSLYKSNLTTLFRLTVIGISFLPFLHYLLVVSINIINI